MFTRARKAKRSGNHLHHVPDRDARSAIFPDGARGHIGGIAFLQKAVGNRALRRLYKRGMLRSSLMIGRTGDTWEREAGRIADEMTRSSGDYGFRGFRRSVKGKVGSVDIGSGGGQVSAAPEHTRTETDSRGTAISRGLADQIRQVRGGGRPLSEKVRAYFQPRFNRDLRGVRIHTGDRAAESAGALNARAYTVGRDIVFGRGRYAPETEEGRRLLAHELTHVCQGREDVILRNGLDSEEPGQRARRLTTINATRRVVRRLTAALFRGYTWPFVERATEGGVYLYHLETEETNAAREGRLRRLISDLIDMMRELESGPIPATWLAPEVSHGSSMLIAGSEREPDLTDVAMFYAHRANEAGHGEDLIDTNVLYILSAPDIRRVVPRVPISRGVNLGIYIHVPDPENRPLVYSRVTGFESRREGGGVILDVWQDDFGYFYIYGSAKHYLPGRP